MTERVPMLRETSALVSASVAMPIIDEAVSITSGLSTLETTDTRDAVTLSLRRAPILSPVARHR